MLARIRQDVAAIETGTPIRYDAQNMDHLNSLQVVHAERYVLSSTEDFALVQDFIAKDPERRFGWHGRLA